MTKSLIECEQSPKKIHTISCIYMHKSLSMHANKDGTKIKALTFRVVAFHGVHYGAVQRKAPANGDQFEKQHADQRIADGARNLVD